MSTAQAPRIPPKGVFVPVPTFFYPIADAPTAHNEPRVDIETQVQHSIFLAESGITGLVLLGSTGEAIHLTRQERFDLVEGVRGGLDAAGFPDYPIMAGVLTSGGIEDTLDWVHDYAKAGAQWALVLVPGYFGASASQEHLVQYFRIVADRSPVPVLVYNYPGVTNNVLVQPETYVDLAAHRNIVGCKMSHGNVSHHVQVSLDPKIDHDQFRVYSGFGQQLGPIVLFGAAGVIDGMAAFYPKTVVRLMALAEKSFEGSEVNAETRAEIQRLQFVVSRAEEFVVRYGMIGIKEGVFRLTGLGTQEGGRLPIRGTLTDEVWEKARGLFLGGIEETEAKL
ncbi:Dihydrodipicolinate synthetase-like protein [Cercophora scortea]|uniref:Dihydrodipicolinate synthetase-like protein n=1 Tax=Cercophora scortea TaxID=314031 RepID=A0AAE0M601_9PEZI|nr:Dihydrodipicolinate synthetase-like protein [Cercophora scortea]